MRTTRMVVAAVIVASGLVGHVTRAQGQEPSASISSGTISASPDARSSRRSSSSTPGVTSSRHTHPGEEIVYVLEGAPLEYEVEGKPAVTLKPGDVLFIPAGTIHSAKNVGSRKGAELATYIVEKGKPLLTEVSDRRRGDLAVVGAIQTQRF